ncbi:MAG: IS2 transposase TnpB [Chloroflexi bacterium ADurb.Bin344]|nr:MAG: IS2 transposase TnpB [Chloroflexi bacterium ADurb.Bin344]
MGIKRSTFYYQKKVNMAKIQQETLLKEKIQQIAYQHPYYGYRRITAQLHRENIKVNHKRVLRMMRELGIQGRIKRKYVTTTNSRHNHRIYPNLIKDFLTTGINQVWCSDITYISILFGFVYLAVIIDIYSRKIVGYAIGKTLSPELTITALKMAIASRRTDQLIHHSDQGIQYTCQEYIKILKDYGIRISMSGKGNPYDNAFAESLIKTLKQEEVYLWQYETYQDVIERIPYFILDVYNKKRLHSALGYRPPEEFESLLAENASTESEKAKTLFV